LAVLALLAGIAVTVLAARRRAPDCLKRLEDVSGIAVAVIGGMGGNATRGDTEGGVSPITSTVSFRVSQYGAAKVNGTERGSLIDPASSTKVFVKATDPAVVSPAVTRTADTDELIKGTLILEVGKFPHIISSREARKATSCLNRASNEMSTITAVRVSAANSIGIDFFVAVGLCKSNHSLFSRKCGGSNDENASEHPAKEERRQDEKNGEEKISYKMDCICVRWEAVERRLHESRGKRAHNRWFFPGFF
jgi:hypothetical protein